MAGIYSVSRDEENIRQSNSVSWAASQLTLLLLRSPLRLARSLRWPFWCASLISVFAPQSAIHQDHFIARNVVAKAKSARTQAVLALSGGNAL